MAGVNLAASGKTRSRRPSILRPRRGKPSQTMGEDDARSPRRRRETHIAAPPAAVFALLTDPRRSCAGSERRRSSSRNPAGSISSMSPAPASPALLPRGVPVHRLAYSFGWDGSDAVPPGSSLVEIDLIEQPDGTLAALYPQWPAHCRAVRRSCQRLAHTRPAAEVCGRARPCPDPWHAALTDGSAPAAHDPVQPCVGPTAELVDREQTWR